jgi:hypothetical protein
VEIDAVTRRRGPDWRAPVIGVGIAIALIVGFGACTAFVAHQLDFEIGRRRLSPIPVPSTACPYLRPIHTVAVKLDDQWVRALDGRDPWPAFRLELTAELPTLEDALTRAQSHVPAPIASKFATVVLDVRLGRAELPRATSVADVLFFPDAGKSAVMDGASALADATDLVGAACGFRLAPTSPLP